MQIVKIKKGAPIKSWDPLKELLDEKLIDAAFQDCLKNNDPEGAIEMIEIHLKAKRKNLKR